LGVQLEGRESREEEEEEKKREVGGRD